jgi:hypothetical protein
VCSTRSGVKTHRAQSLLSRFHGLWNASASEAVEYRLHVVACCGVYLQQRVACFQPRRNRRKSPWGDKAARKIFPPSKLLFPSHKCVCWVPKDPPIYLRFQQTVCKLSSAVLHGGAEGPVVKSCSLSLCSFFFSLFFLL